MATYLKRGDNAEAFDRAKVEATVSAMENAELPLDSIIDHYEKGMRLVATCGKHLDAAEKKIELLTKKASGEIAVSSLETGEDVPNVTPASDSASSSSEEDGVSLFQSHE